MQAGPAACASVQGFAQNCSAQRRSHPDPLPIPPKRSKTPRCRTHRPTLHRGRGSVPESARQPDNRPVRSLKHRERPTPSPSLLNDPYQPCAEPLPDGNGPRTGVPAYPRIETEPRIDAIPSPDPRSGIANRERNESCQSQHRSATTSEPDLRGSALDFLPPREQDSTPRGRVAPQIVHRFRRGAREHTHESFRASRNAVQLRFGPHAEPGSYRPVMTAHRRDRSRVRDWYCRPLPPPPACIHRETRRVGETVFVRHHSRDRDSNQWSCGEFVAVRAGRVRRQSATASGFADDPEWRSATALWCGPPPVQSPTAVRPAANRSPESPVRFPGSWQNPARRRRRVAQTTR